MTSAIPVQRSTNWANKPTGSWSMCWVQIKHPSDEWWFSIYEIHIFALRWRDEIKRSSQLRTLLKRVVENKTIQEFHISKITWMVYLDPTHWPAPSWLVSSIGRALHRYHGGHGFKSCTGLNFFQVLASLTITIFRSE